MPPEQAKALPRDDLVRLAELIRLDAAETPLAASAALMMASMLRPAEACPKYGEIIDCGDYGVYAALHNVAGGERIASMKTRNAYRQVILPKYAMDIVRECREALQKQGYGDSEINDAYVAHHPQDIHRPADPRDISRYVKNKLELLGYNSTYWCGMELVAQTEPDADERGNALTDVTAYLLRRSGSTVTVTIRCHDHDRANVCLPGYIQVAGRMRSSLSPQQSIMPDIQEKITEEYYNTLKEDAQKIYRKAKGIR